MNFEEELEKQEGPDPSGHAGFEVESDTVDDPGTAGANLGSWCIPMDRLGLCLAHQAA